VLNLYIWSSYIAPETLQKFERRHGVRVNVDLYDTNEALLAKLQNADVEYDVICPSNYPLELLLRQGKLRPLDLQALPPGLLLPLGLGQPLALGASSAPRPSSRHVSPSLDPCPTRCSNRDPSGYLGHRGPGLTGFREAVHNPAGSSRPRRLLGLTPRRDLAGQETVSAT